MHKLLLWIVCIQILPFRTLILPRELELSSCCVLAKSPQRYQRTILRRLESVIIIQWKMLLASSFFACHWSLLKPLRSFCLLDTYLALNSETASKQLKVSASPPFWMYSDRTTSANRLFSEKLWRLWQALGFLWSTVTHLNSHRLDDYDASIFECSISASLFLFTTVQ